MEVMKECKYHPFMDSYMDDVKNATTLVGKDILLVMDYLEGELNNPNVFTDMRKLKSSGTDGTMRYKGAIIDL